MRQIKNSALLAITVLILTAVTFTACKKDAFSEKDALAAQTTLLQTKFSYDLAIKTLDLQIQRSGDSAKIVLQNLVNSGATALEILKQTNMLAQILQNQNNALAQLRYADSLSRNTAVISDQLERLRTLWNDSVTLAKTNATLATALKKNYSLSFADNLTNQPLAGVTVSVLASGSSSFTTAVTNAQGTATFTGLIVDPGTFFSASLTGYGLALVREANLTTLNVVNGTTNKYNNPTTLMYNFANTRNTIRGSVLGDVNLTNGEAAEAIAGHLVTFNNSLTLNGSTTLYQFSALSDASGNYSVSVPDGTFTPVYTSTVRVQQKMFVNAWTDEDQTKSKPRIDSTGTTLATFGSAVTNGTGQGYYFTFPSDTTAPTRAVFAATTTNGFNNNIILPQNFTGSASGVFVNRNAGAPKTDSLGSFGFASSGNLYFLNLTTPSSTDNSVVYSRTALYTPAKPTALLPVNLVSLVSGWILAAPLLDAQVNGNTGRINGVQLRGTYVTPFQPIAGSGGIFNNAVMFTPNSGRLAYQNLTAFGFTGQPVYLASLATTILGTNTTGAFAVSGGTSVFLPIEYRVSIARDRTPR
ncbi:MAG: carboxypeptidase-like regulatory domain-containing protein [Sediminibacterium sp.]